MLLYLHGFLSSPASRKAQVLAQHMAERGIRGQLRIAAIPSRPVEAIARLENELAGLLPDDVTVIGSSLGGYYATWLAERHGLRAVLINPAVRPYELLRDYLGPQRNLYTGEEVVITEADLQRLREIDVQEVTRPERYLLFAETGDEVLDYRHAVEKYGGAKQIVIEGGDHSFASFARFLPAIFEFAGI